MEVVSGDGDGEMRGDRTLCASLLHYEQKEAHREGKEEFQKLESIKLAAYLCGGESHHRAAGAQAGCRVEQQVAAREGEDEPSAVARGMPNFHTQPHGE